MLSANLWHGLCSLPTFSYQESYRRLWQTCPMQVCPKELLTQQTACHSSFSFPAFSLSLLRLGKDPRRYLKQSFSLLRALINCFITPYLMYSGGKTIFWRSTNGWFMILSCPNSQMSLKFLLDPKFVFCTTIQIQRKYRNSV